MPPSRILITGASGFAGHHVQAALAAALPDAVKLTPKLDLRDPAAVRAAVRQAAPDACIHLAAIAAPQDVAADPGHGWAVNLHGTLHLVAALREAAPECLLLHASSADCYGASFRAGTSLDESAVLAPMNLYGATKAAADLALGVAAAQGMRVVRLRAFNHTGPGQSEAFVVPAFARQIARIEAGRQAPVLQVGNLDTFRDFLDVRDVAQAYVGCLLHEARLAPGCILNLASGTARRIGDILSDLLALSGAQVEVRAEAARVRATDIPTACGNATAAGRLLGWEPRIPWAQTLADVLADWRARVQSAAA